MNRKRFLGAAGAALIIAILLVLVLAPSVWAQSKFKTLYKFTGGKDGSSPIAVIFDQAGNLYGTTKEGGANGAGAVFKLAPNADGHWTESVLYSFTPFRKDPWDVAAGLTFDAVGNLYGTSSHGGDNGFGTVFKLTPKSDGSWTESVICDFSGGGLYPYAGVIFDQAGNLYGTTGYVGAVFELTPKRDGTWDEKVLYGFEDGSYPEAGLTFDGAGNLYGTTLWRGHAQYGTVFELTPNSDGSWSEKELHGFNRKNGANPNASLIFDEAGNLYGPTWKGGDLISCAYDGCGLVFELTPNADGSWKENVLHRFTDGKDGGFPGAGLIFDKAGNLYGTTVAGGTHGYGVVFKLTPNTNGGWHETVLHTFADHPGAGPGGLIFDAVGNLYGTTGGDGKTTFGSVFEITP
jgi:uncharacterized repeat protein (TIGR03803 family)